MAGYQIVYIASNVNNKSSSPDSQSKPDLCSVADTQNQLATDVAMVAQSGLFTKTSLGTSSEKHQQTMFSDFNSISSTVPAGYDPSFDMATTGDVSLAEFFARPVKIRELTWSVGAGLATVLEPVWREWMDDKRISNRLNNYKNFRGDLHIKFVLNGNQFYWGRAIASYDPYISEFGTGINANQLSTMPHVYLDPSTSTGGELHVPFVFPFNAYDMTDAVLGQTLGQLHVQSITTLEHATGTDPISITIYAWCTNVVLSAPTQTNVGFLTAQSGKSKAKGGDEYGTGPISRPASIVASAAGRLKDVPVIGSYAMATSMMASSVGKIAALFGYSRPAVISEPCLNSPLPQGNLANVDAPDTSRRLALTSKQEVTIDPRVVGIGNGVDELAVDYLNAKESLYELFQWAKSDAVGTHLFSSRVNPSLYQFDTIGGPMQMTPMCLAALPFRFWTGSITFRFQIVASGYHKGRLRIVWDPKGAFVNPESHLAYTHVVDIAEERDFEITVGWGSHAPALRTRPVSNLLGDQPYSNTVTPVTCDDEVFDNGCIAVYVLNELVSSSPSTVPITILVSVKSSDMRYHAPNEARFEDLSYYPPPVGALREVEMIKQSGIVESDENAVNDDMNMSPEGMNEIDQMGHNWISTAAAPVIVGEEIVSFRQCLKRYSQHSILSASASTTDSNGTVFVHKQPAFPYGYGYDTDGVDYVGPGTAGAKCNRCTSTLLGLLGPCYVGWRGSLRWKLTPVAAPCCSWMMQAKRCGSNCSYEDSWENIPYSGTPDMTVDSVTVRQALQNVLQGGWDGVVSTSTQHNPTLEFEIPYYSDQRFLTVPEHGATDSSEGMGWWFMFRSGSDFYPPSTRISDPAIFQTWVAAGEDFGFYFFRSIPLVYKYTLP